MVYPQVRSEIPDSHVGETIGLAEKSENGDSDSNAEITQQNELGVLGFIQWALWVEMVDSGEETVALSLSTTLRLTLVVVVASDVAKEVHRPAEKLLANRVDQSGNRCLLRQLINLVN